MPRRAKISGDSLIDEAIAIIEEDGMEELTIGALATALDVKPPSLYNHVAGIEDVRMKVRIAAVTRLGDALVDAAMGRAGEDALFALCHAYRSFAVANPELYAMSVEAFPGESDEFDRHAWRALRPLFAVLHAHGLNEAEAVHTARTFRASLHGFVMLETAGGFGLPESVDASFDRMVDWLLMLLEPEDDVT